MVAFGAVLSVCAVAARAEATPTLNAWLADNSRQTWFDCNYPQFATTVPSNVKAFDGRTIPRFKSLQTDAIAGDNALRYDR